MVFFIFIFSRKPFSKNEEYRMQAHEIESAGAHSVLRSIITMMVAVATANP